MQAKRNRLGVATVLAVAVGMIAPAGGAHAARVSETAAGGVLANGATPPGGFPQILGPPLIQEFRLSGEKVKGKQVLDVNLTVNSLGSGPRANFELRAKLVGPKGQSTYPLSPLVVSGQSLIDLELDDQSEFRLCNQFFVQASDCNYLQGASPPSGDNGFYTGAAVPLGRLNSVFRGTNPKGTWELIWWDAGAGTTHTIGEATLEVKVGKKFAKED